jgi:nitroreductase
MENIKDIDRIQMGQLIRFKAHMLDVATKTINIDVEARETDLEDLQQLLQEWDQRDYPEGPDILWARQRIRSFRAIKLEDKKAIFIPPSGETVDISQDIFSVIKNRRTVRYWKKKSVPRDIIRRLIEAATYAPTAFNRMEWRFYVAETPLDGMETGDASNPSMFAKAPVRIFVAADERLFFEKYSGSLDTGFALQNLILAAHALGLGTCLIYQGEFVDPQLMEKHYNIPTYMKVYCAVTLGYPDENPETPARMEVDEVTEFLGEVPNPDF